MTKVTAIQTVDITASDKVISKENQDIIIRGFIVWRIVDPEAAFATIARSSNTNPMREINHTCEQIVEAVIRTTAANMTLDQILRERDLIVRKIVGELQDVVDTWGLQIETVEIRDVEIKNLGDEAQNLRGWTLKDISEGYPEFRFGSP